MNAADRKNPRASLTRKPPLPSLRRIAWDPSWKSLTFSGRTNLVLEEIKGAIAGRRRRKQMRTMVPRPGTGLACLFYGPSGTGKTMAASVLAGALDLALYRVDLSSVVSQYIGETERNLSAIFAAAENRDCVLFLDEADVLFGKRTEVSDSHDRYATVETGYLLQRIESFDGIVILATNSKASIDPAFLRRLHSVVRIPAPRRPLPPTPG